MKLKATYPKESLGFLCQLFGYSRQSYYGRKEVSFIKEVMEGFVLDYVRSIRSQAPRLGCEKLYLMVKEHFKEDLNMGRDAFYKLLRTHDLMLKKRKYRVITTNSRHRYKKYPNLIKELDIHFVNQVWVSDITYILTDNGVCYLTLITDAYSHRVMGWNIGPSLETIHVLKALKMAVAQLPTGVKPIHHSDRGTQYCSDLYVTFLTKHVGQISMTDNGDPLENAVAERMNGILKQEWLYTSTCKDMKDAIRQTKAAIDFYNTQRPHRSIDMMTPEQAYNYKGNIERRWKNYYKKETEYLDVENKCVSFADADKTMATY